MYIEMRLGRDACTFLRIFQKLNNLFNYSFYSKKWLPISHTHHPHTITNTHTHTHTHTAWAVTIHVCMYVNLSTTLCRNKALLEFRCITLKQDTIGHTLRINAPTIANGTICIVNNHTTHTHTHTH